MVSEETNCNFHFRANAAISCFWFTAGIIPIINHVMRLFVEERDPSERKYLRKQQVTVCYCHRKRTQFDSFFFLLLLLLKLIYLMLEKTKRQGRTFQRLMEMDLLREITLSFMYLPS